MTIIAQGAEATLVEEKGSIIKKRLPKTYRHPELDKKLRKSRTKRETKVLQKLQELHIPCPEFIDSDEVEIITMKKVPGSKLRDYLSARNYFSVIPLLAKHIAHMHNASIIHGDITTSNIIIDKKTKGITLLDFGLSFFSHKIEDKAVDLHVFEEAIESTHPRFGERMLKLFLEEYAKHANDSADILKRLEKVQKRGRYNAKK